jgi:hypothetical protein
LREIKNTLIWLKEVNQIYFLFISLIATYLVSIPSIFMDGNEVLNYNVDITFKFFSLLVFFGPLLETFVFQFLIYEFLKFLNIRNKIVVVIISSVLFSITHVINNIGDLNHYFSNGIIFMTVYLISIDRKENSPFLNTFIIHFLRNLIAVLGRIFFY